MDTAARIARHGADPTPFLRTRDPFERLVWVAVATRMEELAQEDRKELAVLVATNVGRLFGGRKG